MKIVTIVGARPQFIKLTILSRELRKNHREIIVHTGQHYDYELSKVFFDELRIPEPDYNLDVGSGTQGEQTGEMIKRIEEVLLEREPDLVIVFGDTNSTLAGALAATKLHINIAHVEAGMRNFDRKKPEEINRIVTDHISDILFASTKTAVNNLKDEGIEDNVFLVGDVNYDGLLEFQGIAEERSEVLEDLDLSERGYMVATIHKQKNTNNKERLRGIINAITKADEKILFPIHPRTKKFLKQYGLWNKLKGSNVSIIKPLGYIDFIKLAKYAKKIITDSGGVQKDAYIFKVPCITLRETEWVETVEEGWNTVIEVDEEMITEAIMNFKPKQEQKNFLGNGDACKRIVKILDELKD